MKKRIIVLLTMLLAFLLSACAGQGETAAVANPQRDARLTLSLYCTDECTIADPLIRAFQQVYHGVTIEKREMDWEEFDDVITTEMNAGAGPDIILFGSSALDTRKMAQNGAFLPLDAYLENEKTAITYENYVEGVFDAGKVDGTQYFVPLSIMVPVLQYNLDDSFAFAPAPVISFEEFQQALYEDMETYRNDESYGALEEGALVYCTLLPSQILRYSEEEKTIVYDAEELKEYVDFIAKVKRECNGKEDAIKQRYGNDLLTSVKYFKYRFYCPSDLGILAQRLNMLNQYANDGETGMSVLRYPNDTVPALVGLYGAVNRNAGEKAAYAYEFLRIAAETDTSKKGLQISYMSPNKYVNYEHLTVLRNAYTKMQWNGATIEDNGIGERLEGDLIDIIEGINYVSIPNEKINTIFEECFEPYLEGGGSFESCLQDFDQRINLYMTE